MERGSAKLFGYAVKIDDLTVFHRNSCDMLFYAFLSQFVNLQLKMSVYTTSYLKEYRYVLIFITCPFPLSHCLEKSLASHCERWVLVILNLRKNMLE